jgi:hypothetical protein
VPPTQVVRAECADEHDPRSGELAGCRQEQRAGRRIGPLQVLEHEQHGSRNGDPGQESLHAPEQPRPGFRSLLERCGVRSSTTQRLGDQPRDIVGAGTRCFQEPIPADCSMQRTERLRERAVGEIAVAQPDGAAGEHEHSPLMGGRGEFGHQACLADPRLSRDEDGGRRPLSGPIERSVQPFELRAATGERRADDARRHRRHHRALLGRGQCRGRLDDHPGGVVAP